MPEKNPRITAVEPEDGMVTCLNACVARYLFHTVTVLIIRPLQLNTLFLGPDRPYFQIKLLLVLRSEVGFNCILSMRNRLLEIKTRLLT